MQYIILKVSVKGAKLFLETVLYDTLRSVSLNSLAVEKINIYHCARYEPVASMCVYVLHADGPRGISSSGM